MAEATQQKKYDNQRRIIYIPEHLFGHRLHLSMCTRTRCLLILHFFQVLFGGCLDLCAGAMRAIVYTSGSQPFLFEGPFIFYGGH